MSRASFSDATRATGQWERKRLAEGAYESWGVAPLPSWQEQRARSRSAVSRGKGGHELTIAKSVLPGRGEDEC